MSGIYIHIPFCKQLCYYCDFHFSVSLERKDELLRALVKELQMRSEESKPLNPISTLYIGGGTPTVYSPAELGVLVEAVKSNYDANNLVEFTVEANPDDLNEAYLKGLLSIGVNRLSIGIQSFIDRDLTWMNRRHSAAQAIESVRLAQRIGFSNISLDLIYGIPSMSLDEWRYNVETAIGLGVPHISAYHLGIEKKTVFGKRLEKGQLHAIPEEQSEEQFHYLKELTAAAGFEHYEISNFAKDGRYGIHNTAYWQLKPYIGIGPSAHSFDGQCRRWNVANNKQYIDGVTANGIFFETETPDTSTRYNEYLLTSLRTMWGADTSYIRQAFGESYYSHLMGRAHRFIEHGQLIQEADMLKIPSQHFLISDGIVADLFL